MLQKYNIIFIPPKVFDIKFTGYCLMVKDGGVWA